MADAPQDNHDRLKRGPVILSIDGIKDVGGVNVTYDSVGEGYAELKNWLSAGAKGSGPTLRVCVLSFNNAEGLIDDAQRIGVIDSNTHARFKAAIERADSVYRTTSNLKTTRNTGFIDALGSSEDLRDK